ncbi:hypothetical protein ACHAXT_003530 [Thalassiosira profunda]
MTMPRGRCNQGCNVRGWTLLLLVVLLAALPAPSSGARPARFLRWRTLQDADNVTVSNDFNENTGTFISFSPFGLRLGPVSASGAGENDVLEEQMEGVRIAIESHLNATLDGLAPPLLSKQSISNGLVGGTFAGFAIVDAVRFVRSLPYEEGELVRGRGLEGEEPHGDEFFPLVDFSLPEVQPELQPAQIDQQAAQKMESSSGAQAIDVYVSGGSAFYLYGPAGPFMTVLPTSEDLDVLVAANVNKRSGGDGTPGGMLAGTLRDMAASDDPELGDLSMFESVETAAFVEGMDLDADGVGSQTEDIVPDEETVAQEETFSEETVAEEDTVAEGTVPVEEADETAVESPTVDEESEAADASEPSETTGEIAEDSISPVGEDETAPGGEDSTSAAGQVEMAPGEDSPAGENETAPGGDSPAGESEATPGDGSTSTATATTNDEAGEEAGDNEAQSGNVEGEKAENGEEEEGTADSENEGEEVAAVAAKAADVDGDSDADNNSLGIILGGALAVLLALLAGLGLFVYYKWRQRDAESQDGGVKQVPTSLTDDEMYDDAYGEFYGPTAQTGDVEENVGDVVQAKGAVGGGNALQLVTPREATKPEEHSQPSDLEATEDWAFEKMLATAASFRTPSLVSVATRKENPNDSLDPQLDEKETSRSIESGPADASGEIDDRDIIAGARLVKSRSLGSHDSLNRMAPSRLPRSRSQNIADLDILADLENARPLTPAKDLVYDDIEEAQQLAAAVKRANSIEVRERSDVMDADSTDGFTDFEAIVERKQSRSEWTDTKRPEAFAPQEILNDIHEAERKESLVKARESPALADTTTAFTSDTYHGGGESHIGLLEDDEDDVVGVGLLDEDDDDVEGRSHINLLEEDDGDGEIKPHDILPVINEVARTRSMNRTPSPALILDSYVARRAASPSHADPPGDESLVSGGGDDSLLADLTVVETSEVDAQVAARCSFLPKRSFVCRQGQKDDLVAVVSDDEGYDDDRNVARPWNDNWSDPYSGETKGGNRRLRMVSPTFRGSNDAELTDGSNYDPDSDWDVDDTEMEDFGPPGEEFDAARATRDSEALRIW